MMGHLGFSSAIVTQLSLAEVHGNLHLSLGKIEEYLDNLAKVKKKLIEVATYPLILLAFLLLIMLGLRNYLLPQLDSSNIATIVISNLPQIFLGLVIALGLLSLTGLIFYRKSAKIQVFSFLARIPFLGVFVQYYLTAYYAREWGNMIGQGLELSQIFQMMQEQGNPLFREIGQDLDQALQNGHEFSKVVQNYPFFRRELGLIIEYGEVKSKLGSELEIYAEKTWEAFFASQSYYELSSTAGIYFCSPTNRFIVRSHVAAHVSKYGGEFLDEKNVDEIKRSQGKSFYTGRNVGRVAHH